MCGIAGIVDLSSRSAARADMPEIAARMAQALVHRGPDDSGVWHDLEAGVALSFRRLAIIDLSPAGHQPMTSASGRYVIVFNGEIYNYDELRKEFPDVPFRGHSDTEVLLAAIEAWGPLEALRRSVGMFGIGLWDRRDRTLTLARDRIGEKPLYYGMVDGNLAFGSELKAIARHPRFRGEIDRGALTLFMRYGYVPAPYSIYKEIHKLPPGMLLTIHADGGTNLPKPEAYWSALQAAEAGAADPFTGSPEEAVEHLEELLTQSVRSQMVADVPLGAFLSGGIDSSLTVALMQKVSTRPVKSYSIGFQEADYNEAHHAKLVATHLGADHAELYVSPAVAQSVIPKLPEIYDEPFADSSQIPTYLVSQFARGEVTVSLTGDGGDELFYGYRRYRAGNNVWGVVGTLPRWTRRMMGRTIMATPAGVLNAGFGWMSRFGMFAPGSPASERFYRLAGVLALDDFDDYYQQLVSFWQPPVDVVTGGYEMPMALTEGADTLQNLNRRMMHYDLTNYLTDDILAKVDRAAMAVSLETRAPFLDHRVVEFSCRLPIDMMYRDGQTKWALRKILYKYVPREMLERPKMGFSIPVGQWLRGPMRDWVEHLLSPKLLTGAYLNADLIRKRWNEHLNGTRNWQHEMWFVLMFQAWREHVGLN